METVTINGWTVFKSDDHIIPHIEEYPNNSEYSAWQSGFHDDIMEIYLPENSEKRIAIDVGANYGFTTVPFSRDFQEVHSFEVLPQVRECLIKNTKHLNNVTIHDCGLGGRNSDEDVLVHETSPGLSIIKPQFPGTEKYKCRKLDDFNFKNVDLVKIDVEGWEPNVILGAKKTLKENSPVVIVEIHALGRSRENMFHRHQVIHTLIEYGYHIIDIRGPDIVFSKNKSQINKYLDQIFPEWWRVFSDS